MAAATQKRQSPSVLTTRGGNAVACTAERHELNHSGKLLLMSIAAEADLGIA